MVTRERGIDPAAGKRQLVELEQRHLLAWAAELAEQETVLSTPVSFVEAPLRPVTTAKVSEYAARYLRTLSLAHSALQVGTRARFTTEWWNEREAEALGALAALRAALEQADAASAKDGE